MTDTTDERPGTCTVHWKSEAGRLREAAITLRRAWDALCDCVNEFEPEDMAACGERRDDLDTAILGVIAALAGREGQS